MAVQENRLAAPAVARQRRIEAHVADAGVERGRPGSGGHVADRAVIEVDVHAGFRRGGGADQAEQQLAAVGGLQRVPADEVVLVELHELTETGGVGRQPGLDVGAVVEDPRLDPPEAHRRRRAELHPERRPAGEQAVPEGVVVGGLRAAVAVDLDPDLPRPPGARHPQPLAAHIEEAGVEVLEVRRQPAADGRVEHVKRLGSLDLQHPRVGVAHLDVEADGVGLEPALELAVGLDVPEPVAGQPHDHAVHQDGAVGTAGKAVAGPPDRESLDPAGEDLLKQPARIGADDLERLLRDVVQHHAAPQLPVVGDRVLVGGRLHRVEAVAVQAEDRLIGCVAVGERGLPDAERAQLDSAERLDVVVPVPGHRYLERLAGRLRVATQPVCHASA